MKPRKSRRSMQLNRCYQPLLRSSGTVSLGISIRRWLR